MRIYGYLRASTKEQDAERAKEALLNFSELNEFKISKWIVENESGAKLDRPELFRLLDWCEPGDAILIEQIDRITRLDTANWKKLKALIEEKKIRILSLDLPTSYIKQAVKLDDFTNRMFEIINEMLMDILAAAARKDYDDRRRRQDEGIKKAQKQGKYKGKQVNKELHAKIKMLVDDGKSYKDIRNLIGCSYETIARVKKDISRQLDKAA